MQRKTKKLRIHRQPDDVSCGPTCLHSIYEHYSDIIELDELIQQVKMIESGGTYASWLGLHALKRGYEAKIWSSNLNVFDPSWFDFPEDLISKKLEKQIKAKPSKRLKNASFGYIEFIKSGGHLCFDELTPESLASMMQSGHPLIAGLSSTYLYKSMRERSLTNEHDDIRGTPCGHFVVISNVDLENNKAQILDPYFPNKLSHQNTYTVSITRLIAAILLGVMTYDANLLMIYKDARQK